LFVQATACAFRFLRQPSRPRALGAAGLIIPSKIHYEFAKGIARQPGERILEAPTVMSAFGGKADISRTFPNVR